MRDFYAGLCYLKVWQKQDEQWKDYCLHKIFFLRSSLSNSKVNRQNYRDIERIRDFMPALVTIKFDENLVKNEGAIESTTKPPLNVSGQT